MIYELLTSKPIIVGKEFKSPYQWAAKLAPSDLLVPYKNALLWLEGMEFRSIEDLEEKIQKVIYYQTHGEMPEPSLPSPYCPHPLKSEPDSEPSSEADFGSWTDVKKNVKPWKPPKPAIPSKELAFRIMQAAHKKLQTDFRYNGPTIKPSDVYEKFSAHKGVYDPKKIMYLIRAEMVKPEYKLALPVDMKHHYYEAVSSAGKGKNFNIKIKRKPSEPSLAQIHIVWEE